VSLSFFGPSQEAQDDFARIQPRWGRLIAWYEGLPAKTKKKGHYIKKQYIDPWRDFERKWVEGSPDVTALATWHDGYATAAKFGADFGYRDDDAPLPAALDIESTTDALKAAAQVDGNVKALKHDVDELVHEAREITRPTPSKALLVLGGLFGVGLAAYAVKKIVL